MNSKEFRRSLATYIYGAFGQPVSIHHFTNKHLGAKLTFPNSNCGIAANNSMRWHYWGSEENGDSGSIPWWYQGRDGYKSSFRQIAELKNFSLRETLEQWECDIQDVEGLAAAKSDLNLFDTLDALVESNSPEMIDEISERKLHSNLNHWQIRIRNSEGGGGDFFARYLWDGPRTFLINAGGAHHFAAARYIAAKLKIPVPLSGRLDIYRIPPLSAEKLMQQFDLYAMTEQHNYGFCEAMRSFKASYGICKLPHPHHENIDLILLPRNEPRSMKVSVVLKETGVFDVSDYLRQSLRRQSFG